MTEHPATAPPVVCTLTDTELGQRALEWADLAELSLTSTMIPGGVASTYPAVLVDALRDLADRETSCCGTWLTSAVTPVNGTVRLELTTTNPDGIELIRSMAGHSA